MTVADYRLWGHYFPNIWYPNLNRDSWRYAVSSAYFFGIFFLKMKFWRKQLNFKGCWSVLLQMQLKVREQKVPLCNYWSWAYSLIRIFCVLETLQLSHLETVYIVKLRVQRSFMLPIHKFIAESLSQFLLDSLLRRFSIFLSGLKIVETFYAGLW